MAELLALVVSSAVTIVALFSLLRWDEARLDPGARARCWPGTTKAIAAVVFGVLAVPVHFGRTRRSLVGVGEGLAWGVGIFALDLAVATGVETLAELARLP
jgi:hypothetical protein